MIVLAIDTAGENCAVALARAGGSVTILARHSENIGRGQAERLMAMVGETLAAAGLSYADLARIAVTTGPGSFTGTRIGVAAARGLALALAIPAVGVGVLDALIEEAGGGTGGLAVAALDARRGEIYAKAVMPGGENGGGATVLEAHVTTAAELAQAVADQDCRPLTLIGSAAAETARLLAGAGVEATIASDTACAGIDTVAALAARGGGTAPPVPLYLRAPDAKPQTGLAVARK